VLLVRVELHSARTGRVTEIGRMRIYNDGTSRVEARGNYRVDVMRKGPPWHWVQRCGSVCDFPRKSYSVWRLVLRALAAAFPKERR
jgi:hypothetical protein